MPPLAIQESESTWVIYPTIDECGVRMRARDVRDLAEAILGRVR